MSRVVVPESQPWEKGSDYDIVGANGGDKSWKEARGLTDDGSCRICTQHSEKVEHLVAACTKLANSEYLTRHNQAVTIFAVAWAKQQELVGQEAIWYEQRWDRGTVLENDKAKLMRDFEFQLRKTTTARRPDLILELKTDKKICVCDNACPQQNDIRAKRTEKLKKYRQTTCLRNERATSRLGDIGGSCRIRSIGRWYKSV